MSGLDKDQIRAKAVESVMQIEVELRTIGLGMMTVGLMGNFVESEDTEFGQKQAVQAKDEAKTNIGLGRSREQGYYNVAADKYPVTPYIRIIDNYE